MRRVTHERSFTIWKLGFGLPEYSLASTKATALLQLATARAFLELKLRIDFSFATGTARAIPTL